MGTTSSSASEPPVLTECPEGVRQINRTVWELYTPEPPACEPEVEVIFFHGLQMIEYKDAFWQTWLTRDGTVLWPKTWLQDEFPAARILTISYDSCARETSLGGRNDIFEIGETFVQDIVLDPRSNVGQKCPVIMVGHSLGGIIIKHFILSCENARMEVRDDASNADQFVKLDKFLSNLSGVFYYGTPHRGSKIADLAAKFQGSSPVLNMLQTLDTSTARINHSFQHWKDTPRIPTAAIGESLAIEYEYRIPCCPWPIVLYRGIVVTEASAREGDLFQTAPANHFDVCKPATKTSSSFAFLTAFIGDTVLHGSYTRPMDAPEASGSTESSSSGAIGPGETVQHTEMENTNQTNP